MLASTILAPSYFDSLWFPAIVAALALGIGREPGTESSSRTGRSIGQALDGLPPRTGFAPRESLRWRDHPGLNQPTLRDRKSIDPSGRDRCFIEDGPAPITFQSVEAKNRFRGVIQEGAADGLERAFADLPPDLVRDEDGRDLERAETSWASSSPSSLRAVSSSFPPSSRR